MLNARSASGVHVYLTGNPDHDIHRSCNRVARKDSQVVGLKVHLVIRLEQLASLIAIRASASQVATKEVEAADVGHRRWKPTQARLGAASSGGN